MNPRARIIWELRRSGESQSEIGRRVGRSQVAVWKWFHGKALPDSESLQRIVEAYPHLAPYVLDVVMPRRTEAA